jgi:hypothetical protein
LEEGTDEMADELTMYLTARGAVPVDETWLESLVDEMSATIVPAIVAEIKERENLAAELRYAPVRRGAPAN